MNKNDYEFIGREVMKALSHQIKVFFPIKQSLDRCAGWFSEQPAEIVVASKCSPDEFLSIFIHESCHMDQFFEQTGEWTNPVINDFGDILSEFLDHTRKNRTKLVDDYTKAMLELEIDCEKRAVHKINKYKLSPSSSLYTKRANCYLFSFVEFLNLRCWYASSHRPYSYSRLVSVMPDRFLTLDEYWAGNERVHKFLENHGKSLDK